MGDYPVLSINLCCAPGLLQFVVLFMTTVHLYVFLYVKETSNCQVTILRYLHAYCVLLSKHLSNYNTKNQSKIILSTNKLYFGCCRLANIFKRNCHRLTSKENDFKNITYQYMFHYLQDDEDLETYCMLLKLLFLSKIVVYYTKKACITVCSCVVNTSCTTQKTRNAMN